jgi:hypothetical protein
MTSITWGLLSIPKSVLTAESVSGDAGFFPESGIRKAGPAGGYRGALHPFSDSSLQPGRRVRKMEENHGLEKSGNRFFLSSVFSVYVLAFACRRQDGFQAGNHQERPIRRSNLGELRIGDHCTAGERIRCRHGKRHGFF